MRDLGPHLKKVGRRTSFAVRIEASPTSRGKSQLVVAIGSREPIQVMGPGGESDSSALFASLAQKMGRPGTGDWACGAADQSRKLSHGCGNRPELTEESCIDKVMRLRFGDEPCNACGSRQGYFRETRNRAFSCRSCGMKVFPCQGTPFAKGRPTLVEWFRAIDLAARGMTGNRLLRRRLKLDRRMATEIEAGIRRLKRANDPVTGARWFHEIADYVATQREASATQAVSLPFDRESLWESLRATAAASTEQRPFLGLAAVAALMLVGLGIGWLIVPAGTRA